MKFNTAKYITGAILFAAMAIAIVGMLMLEKGSSIYNAAIVAIIVMLIAALSIAAIWGRCPHCGHRLLSKLFKWEHCPRCGKALNGRSK